MTLLAAFVLDGLLAEDERCAHDHLQVDGAGPAIGVEAVMSGCLIVLEKALG